MPYRSFRSLPSTIVQNRYSPFVFACPVAVMFRDNLMTTGQAKTKGLYLFWTMVDGREKNGLYDLYEDVIAEMGLPVLSTRLPDSKKFRRDLSEERKSVFRSTIFPMDASLLKGSGIREFSEEISRIIRPQ